mmetsp:Transcript_7951/g.18580  ORF Transcript_7951/g.18580 Transcript_7951/m.18580 type:complete len:206 (+) Transcript_7951:1074-1691(+)
MPMSSTATCNRANTASALILWRALIRCLLFTLTNIEVRSRSLALFIPCARVQLPVLSSCEDKLDSSTSRFVPNMQNSSSLESSWTVTLQVRSFPSGSDETISCKSSSASNEVGISPRTLGSPILWVDPLGPPSSLNGASIPWLKTYSRLMILDTSSRSSFPLASDRILTMNAWIASMHKFLSFADKPSKPSMVELRASHVASFFA